MIPVSFVVPVRNGAPWLRDVIQSITNQADGRRMEIIVVDDGSSDDSRRIAETLETPCPLQVLDGPRRGMAAALNRGIAAAKHPIICQVDQDVILDAGWMQALVDELQDPTIAAAQGCYTAPRGAGFWSRIAGADVQLRYAAIRGSRTGHVCTGNTAYRAAALAEVGPFDEQLGYGVDNDMSYRLQDGGYTLAMCRTAGSRHHWREGVFAYCRQQYGLGFGRLDVLAKHPHRVGGDSVSPLIMMLHPALTSVALIVLVAAIASGLGVLTFGPPVGVAALLLGILGAERLLAGVRAAARFREPVALCFPIAHLARDLVWVYAIVAWSTRWLLGRVPKPEDSMRPRPTAKAPVETTPIPVPRRILGLVPAHNEVTTLPAVVAEARRCCPGLDILVVDDGSTDGTDRLVETLGVRWVRLPDRMGVGSAVRAGLRLATRLGFDGVVRLDGDGQHRADDVNAVLEPLRQGRADVVMGSRYVDRSLERTGVFGLLHRLLAFCLSALTRRTVTDPTSGFCALGPRAVRVLAEHHPTGYPEPELHLFAARSGLSVVEVPVRARQRLGGQTSLTPTRIAAAAARVLLAMMIVPLRTVIGDAPRD